MQSLFKILFIISLPYLLGFSLLKLRLPIEKVRAVDPSGYSFQRKTWYDGTRYWRSYNDTSNSRIRFDYSSDGSSWTEDTSAQIAVNTSDFSVYGDSSNAFIAYTNGYDIETRKGASYPGTGFSWGTATIVYNGNSATDYYQYPTLTYDSNSKVWVSANYYASGSISNKAIAASSDDSDETFTGTYNDNRVHLYIGGKNTGTTNYYGGYRFTNITVPQYATISSAKIDFQNAWSGGNYTSERARLYFEAADSSATFSSGSKPSGRTVTSNSALWSGSNEFINSGTWFSASTNFKPPELATSFQEVVNRSGWASGNAASVIAKPDSTGTDGFYFEPYAYDDTGTGNEPRLNITWTTSQIVAVQASSANDISAWGTSTSLDYSSNTNKYGVLVPELSGSLYAVWVDGTTLEGKNYNGSSWDSSPSSIGTVTTGTTTTISAVSDDTGYLHLAYINGSGNTSYRKYTGSWSSEITLDSNSGNTYPTMSLDSTTGDLYTTWIRSSTIYYKKANNPGTNYALNFDGTNDYVNVPYSASQDPSTNLTVEFWFKPDVTINSGSTFPKGIISKAATNTDTDNDWVFFFESGESGRMRFGTYGDNVQTTTSTWLANTWYHISATVDGSNNAYIYVNGVQDNYGGDTSVNGNGINGSQNTPLNIGMSKLAGADYYFDGVIDDVRLYDTARTSTQIQDDMNSELVGTETNLIGYWKLNNGSGQTVTDSDSNANHGTLGVNSSAGSDDPYWTVYTGVKSSTSLYFDGSNDYANIPYNANYDFYTDLTVEFWFKPDVTIDSSISSIKAIMCKCTSTTDSDNDWVFFWSNTEGGQMRFGTYGDNVKTTTTTWTANTWYHIAATVSSTNTALIYVNGVQDNSGGDTSISADPVNSSTATPPLNIGMAKTTSGTFYFDGQIDDVRIYNTARTATQIQSDMYSELTGSESNLGGYWKLNDGTGQTVTDSDSNANNGTLGVNSSAGSDDPSWNPTIPVLHFFDPSATSWKTTGTNTYTSANEKTAGKIFAMWYNGSAITWDTILAGVVISINRTSDGTIAYGTVPISGSQTTITLSDTQTVQNDGNVAEDFTIKTSNATGGTTWTLGGTIGTNIYKHEFSTNGGTGWTVFTTADTYQSLVSNIAASSSQNIDFRLNTPSSTSDFAQKSITITVLAAQH